MKRGSRNPDRLLPAERRRRILSAIETEGRAVVSDLSRKLGISQSTLRKGLDYLQLAGATGFAAQQRTTIVLQLNQTARVDFALGPGNVTQAVSVTAEQPLLQTYTTQLGTVIDSHETEAFPLISRDYIKRVVTLAADRDEVKGGSRLRKQAGA